MRSVPPQPAETSMNLARGRRVKRPTSGVRIAGQPSSNRSREEKMLKSFAKTTFFAVALSFPLCEPASADFMEALKVSPHRPLLFEVESDGESWTSIKPGDHLLEVNIDI